MTHMGIRKQKCHLIALFSHYMMNFQYTHILKFTHTRCANASNGHIKYSCNSSAELVCWRFFILYVFRTSTTSSLTSILFFKPNVTLCQCVQTNKSVVGNYGVEKRCTHKEKTALDREILAIFCTTLLIWYTIMLVYATEVLKKNNNRISILPFAQIFNVFFFIRMCLCEYYNIVTV